MTKTKIVSKVQDTTKDLDLIAIVNEAKRIRAKLEENRKKPKYCHRSNSYDGFFAMQERLKKQLEAAIEAYERRKRFIS